MSDQGQLWNAGRVLIKSKRGRKLGQHDSCRCGQCDKCKHREYMRLYYHGIRKGRKSAAGNRSGPNKNGYMLIRLAPDDPLIGMATQEGVVLEHRLVMARHLGRPLTTDEFPHHKNGDKTDNRIANLELWTTSHPKGQRVEDKLEWAIEFIRAHAPGLFSPDDQTTPVPRRDSHP